MVNHEVVLIEKRDGSDGFRYVAEVAGPYEGGRHYWFVWRHPLKEGTGAAETRTRPHVCVRDRAQADRDAKAWLDRHVP